ncbi:DNA polymerase III subunit delta [Flammeovirga kamogawensis]|uniref:DNA polymerase III subunit delta n=1 Tax=Flammeovirga kamogawensis TaxID=373891 RepID=A0ABX8GWE4_9BACT|nr:DNA polymerase III subunit delta [Flammeovirga kamogawensis]MBB6461625.1 DNA polymerase-3 subunit delta [Flammeovirga kamogawensis]QWG07447.1 DNA polymerase III subunit delta [Flammeovirga kamogawensis]TRX69259.1 DNA polymerase III subunit delta [Flammeovirga kamogawensis]
MAFTAESILADMKANKFAPMYVLQGDEPFYIDKIASYIEENALTEAEKSFNQTILYGKDTTLTQVLESARRFPMMAMRQVIIVKEGQDLPDLNRKGSQDIFAQYAANPVPTTVLVIALKNKKLDGRGAAKKAIEKNAVLLDTKKMYDNKIPNWIKSYCKDKNYKIKDRAINLIAEYIGNDLIRIANELEKLMLNYSNDTEISEALIAKHIGISREYNVFELQNALGKKDILKANRIVMYFNENPKSNPFVVVVGTLFSYFSKVLVVHENYSQADQVLSKLLGVNPYFIKDYKSAANNYPREKVLNVIESLQDADLKAKGIRASLSDDENLKELVFKILH